MAEITNQDILNEVHQLSGKVDKIYATLFGKDGMGGLSRGYIELQSSVYGNPVSRDDTGLVGDTHYVRAQIDGNGGREGLKSRVNMLEDVRKTQNWWNRGLSVAQVVTWVVGILTGFIRP